VKHKEIKPYREAQLIEQNNICPLCELEIEPKQAALDHCHDSGTIRMVLHLNCNGIEGRLNHWAKRSKVDKQQFLRNVADYWDIEFDNPTHPRHK
jgi:hypothetical protein